MDIRPIQDKVSKGEYYWRQHAVERSIEREVAEEEVAEVILAGEIIEEYPEDKYGPSCLIFGRTRTGRPMHAQCSLPPSVWIITLYEPDPEEWIDFRKRRE
ncbi:MAG: DUF4258 domain-containing protein [Deltaproteobacteria bacterium]|nr:DUF4258 domain-containing protein [Deltaproteobacteria bacterium]